MYIFFVKTTCNYYPKGVIYNYREEQGVSPQTVEEEVKMSRYEFFTLTGVKLISVTSSSFEAAEAWFRINYPFWNFAYISRV